MGQKIKIEKKYLCFAVQRGGAKRTIQISRGDEILYQFAAPFWQGEGPEQADFYGELPVGHLADSEIELEIIAEHSEPEPRVVFWQSEELVKDFGRERYPYIHFAPKCGWQNDPNGLCYYQGEYHLFYQHNMFDTKWEDIGWGHAVSKDLLHWTHVEEALLPDRHGAIFSGCAIVNEVHEVSGSGGHSEKHCMPECPENALLLYYTSAGGASTWSRDNGSRFDQRVAWSTDGRTFHSLEKPVLPFIVHENRDPKVYWNEATGNYYMILFLDEHDYGIFVSENLRDWEQTQTLTIQESWECPDLVSLPVHDGAGQKIQEKWLFWTPDSYYLVGEFDGRRFTAEQKIQKLYGCGQEDRKAYAAQSFWGIPGRCVQLPWVTIGERNGLYSGIMGLPREMVLLWQENEGTYLLAEPLVRGVYEQCRTFWKGTVWKEKEFELSWEDSGAVLVELVMAGMDDLDLTVCGKRIVWNSESGELRIDGLLPHKLPFLQNLVIAADRHVLEVGCNQDTVLYYAETDGDLLKQLKIRASAELSIGIIGAEPLL